MSFDGHGGFGQIGRALDQDGRKAKLDLKTVPTRRILSLFRPYRFMFAVILLLVLVGSLLNLIPPLIMKSIIDTAIPEGDRTQLYWLVSGLILLPLLTGFAGVLQNHLNSKVGQSVMRDIRAQLFGNLQKQSMSFFTHAKSGEIVQRLTGDVQAVQDVITRLIVSAVTQVVVVTTTIAILFALDWQLAIISIIILPLFVLPVRTVSRIRKRIRSEAQATRGELAAQLTEFFGVSGALLTRIFTREKQQQRRFDEMNQRVMDLELRTNLVGRWFLMIMGVLGPIGTAIIFLYAGIGVMDGRMSVGDIVAFTAYLGKLYGPVSQLMNLQVELATAAAVFQRIFEYADMVPEIQDAPNARELQEVKGKIEFEQVVFRYRGNNAEDASEEDEVLRGITLSVEPGQMLAIVGPSGAGKTTLIGMIARLYDPVAGCVKLDGLDLRGVSLESLRKQIAFVTQEPFLFHATVKENLKFARVEATDEDLEEACRAAYIDEMIRALPQGYDTMVGERGHRLSGGERQRLSIARAILRDPAILVLDEATSHLDSASEAMVQAALANLMKGRTTVVIAHRLSTILAADQIAVLDHGQLVELGTHDELLAEQGCYADLFNKQFAAMQRS